jgi:hypothetical protein
VYNFPRLTQLQVSQFLTYAILKKVKKNIYFGNARQFCYCWSETADEGDGRIMMGDNADGEVVMLRSIRLHCVEVWISAGLYSVCRYIVNDLMYNGLRLARNLSEGNHYVKSGSVYMYIFVHT